METIVETIRAALADDATPDARAAGVAACRAILAKLEPPSPPAPAAPMPNIAGIVGALRNVPPNQLLDLAIAKLRGSLPAGTDVPPVTPLKFHLVQGLRPRRTS
jgi:hypothetical protein